MGFCWWAYSILFIFVLNLITKQKIYGKQRITGPAQAGGLAGGMDWVYNHCNRRSGGPYGMV